MCARHRIKCCFFPTISLLAMVRACMRLSVCVCVCARDQERNARQLSCENCLDCVHAPIYVFSPRNANNFFEHNKSGGGGGGSGSANQRQPCRFRNAYMRTCVRVCTVHMTCAHRTFTNSTHSDWLCQNEKKKREKADTHRRTMQ